MALAGYSLVVELENTTELTTKLAVARYPEQIPSISYPCNTFSKINLKITFNVTCLLLVVLRLGLEQLEIKIWFSEPSYVLVNWFEL